MKFKIYLLLCGLCMMQSMLLAQNLVQDIQLESNATKLKMTEFKPDAYRLEIAGPDNYYWSQRIIQMDEVTVTNKDENGNIFKDGNYKLQVTPIFRLNDAEQAAFRKLLAENKSEAVKAFRAEHKIPEEVTVFNISFYIKDGQFVQRKEETYESADPDIKWSFQDKSYQSMFAHVRQKKVNVRPLQIRNSTLARDNTRLTAWDQKIQDDLIVVGSSCVGFDCNSGESFGFDTQRYKENNLRIHFVDTSTTGSFPSNDWQITVNDSENGGSNYFAIEDITGGRIPFLVEASAPSNSLYVDNGGRIGFGTSNPTVELHVVNGDSPTLRLEQDGSSGFTSQTWDVVGNETNFFIRDASNGSKLPFKIRPSAPTNSIYIDTDGDIGLGTASPSAKLHVESGDVYVKSGKLGIGKTPLQALDVLGNASITGDIIGNGGWTQIFNAQGATFFTPSFSTLMRLDAANGRVGIGVAAPGYQLQLSTDDAYKPSGGTWFAASDQRLKQNIQDFTDGLDVVLQMRPVRYQYNGKLDLPTDKEHIGIIAQEMQAIAPYTVMPMKHHSEEAKAAQYLAYDASSVTYILVNAIQDQQELIEAQQEEIRNLKAQVSEMDALRSQMTELAQQVARLSNSNSTTQNSDNE